VTEYLFRNETLLDEAIRTAIEDDSFRSDDLEFTFAARVSGCLHAGDLSSSKGLQSRPAFSDANIRPSEKRTSIDEITLSQALESVLTFSTGMVGLCLVWRL
jgi:hypothetical protein